MIPDLDTGQLHERLATIVGAEYVSALPASCVYGGLLGAGRAAPGRVRALVRPATAEQVQHLVPMVAELLQGLWYTPNGAGNGAFAGHPRKPGVLIDLSRMDRIIEVDRRGAFAVLEAGVSFEQLSAHLRERDLPLWTDADPNGAHSVAGSIAERQWGLTPYGDHQAAQCGLEAVLSDGTLLRTGMGALPGSACWPRYKYNFGAALDGLFSRDRYGVVTRLGLWLMPTPRRFMPFMAPLADLATVGALIDRLRPLQLDGSLSGRLAIVSHLSDAALLARCQSDATLSDPPPWTLYGALYGLPDNVDYHWQTLSEACASESGAHLTNEGSGPLWPLRMRQLRGEALYSDSTGADTQPLSFCLLAPPSGRDALALHHGVLARLSEFTPQITFQLAPRLLAMQVEVVAAAADYGACHAGALAALNDLVARGYGVRHCTLELDDAVAANHTHAGLRHLHDGLRIALDPYASFAAHNQFKLDKS